MAFEPGHRTQRNTLPSVQRLVATKPTEHELSVMRERFVAEYLIDLNGTAAAIRAGYEPTKAGAAAAKLMKPGSVTANAVARAMAARATRTGITQDRVLRELGRIAFADPRCTLNEDGTLKPPSQLDDNDAAVVAGVKSRRMVELNPETGKIQQAEVQEVKFHDKLNALDKIARHLGMYNDKLDVTVTSLAQRLDDAFKRTGRVIDVADESEEYEAEAEAAEIEEQEDEVRAALLGVSTDLDDEMREMLGL
jgi:phage terminase small subunit